MGTRIGINGFGRIGRQVTRAIIELYPQKLEVAAVNDLADAKTNAHLFRYDTNYGIYPGTVEARNSNLVIDGKEIKQGSSVTTITPELLDALADAYREATASE